MYIDESQSVTYIRGNKIVDSIRHYCIFMSVWIFFIGRKQNHNMRIVRSHTVLEFNTTIQLKGQILNKLKNHSYAS